MITRFNRIIFLILVISLTLYVAFLNQDIISIYLTPGTPITGYTGVILIAAFALGVLVMSVIALWFGLRSYFRERSLHSKERERLAFYQDMIKARSHSAAGEWFKAKEQWENAVRKDPTHILARIELSKAYEAFAGENSSNRLEALRVLDAARASEPKNIEVLFRAAEINMTLNNKTAALDNLALIIYDHPNKRALLMARNISEELGRLEDALEYHKQLEIIGDADEECVTRIHFKQLLRDSTNSATSQDRITLRDSIRAFTKKNNSYAPALVKLAELENQLGKSEEAAQLFIKAAKVSGSKEYCQNAARLFIKNNMPEKAIAAVKSLANDSQGNTRIWAEIEAIRLYIALNMLDEAKKTCEAFPFLLKRENVSMPRDQQQEFLALKGLCHARMGDTKLAADALKRICEDKAGLNDLLTEGESGSKDDAPAPRLSTP